MMCTGVKMRVAEKVAQQGGTYCTACVLADTALKRVNSRRAEIRKKATSERVRRVCEAEHEIEKTGKRKCIGLSRTRAVEVLWMKHGRMKTCLASAGCDQAGKSVGLFAQRMSMETPELTLPRQFRKGAECVSVFTRKQRLLSVSRSCVGNVRGACLLSARGARA